MQFADVSRIEMNSDELLNNPQGYSKIVLNGEPCFWNDGTWVVDNSPRKGEYTNVPYCNTDFVKWLGE